MAEGQTEKQTRYETLPLPLKIYFLTATSVGILLAVYFIFGFRFGGFTFYDAQYYFLLYALFGSCVFLIMPEGRKLQWYDLVWAASALALNIYFFTGRGRIALIGWTAGPTGNLVLGCIFLLVLLEGCRRASGSWAWPAVAALFAIYPLFADHFPGVFMGVPHSFSRVVSYYAFGTMGVLGMPGQVMGGILMGFLVFAGFLIATGAGKLFLDIAYSLFGRYRGGPAKVAVVSSGFFGSLSGSIAANIVATGSVTIPAMKRMGYPARYAGAIEACASTGGVLMPPVMGYVTFVMAVLLGIPYYTIILAAAVPSILFYWGLLIQADAYAAKAGLKGLPREEIPPFWGVMKKAWPLAAVLLFLIWGLLYMRWEFLTPFYATGLLLLLSFANRETMITPRKFVSGIYQVGRIVTITMSLILPAGIVMCAISITGVGAAFASGAVALGGASLYVIMILGVLACYVMGMAGLIISAYIFLAVTMAPNMVAIGGLNEVAVHLFIVYYAMLAFITPPVATAVFIASAISGAPPLQTGLTSMRLGIVIYFVPFFFVFNPALILQGPSLLETLYLFILCLLGILILAGGMEGYLLKLGILELWSRPLLVLGGFLIALPQLTTTFIGAALTALVIGIVLVRKRVKAEKPVISG